MAQQKQEAVGNAPEKKFRAGGVTATIWANKGEIEGKEVVFKTVQVVRSYKDKENNWQKTSTFRMNDLPKVELVTRKAYEYLALAEEQGDDE